MTEQTCCIIHNTTRAAERQVDNGIGWSEMELMVEEDPGMRMKSLCDCIMILAEKDGTKNVVKVVMIPNTNIISDRNGLSQADRLVVVRHPSLVKPDIGCIPLSAAMYNTIVENPPADV